MFHRVPYQCWFVTLILIGSINGQSESNIQCEFSEGNKSVYWTGEFVEGNIEFNNPDYKGLKLKSIDVELFGILVYKRVYTDKKKKVETIVKTFLNQRLNLNSSNVRGGFVLSYGNHKWPFRFFLNDSLPPSIKQRTSTDSYIHYYIQIVFTRPEWYKRNIKKTIPIVVRHASSPVDPTKLEAEADNRKGLHFRVVLSKSSVAVGKNVSFNIKILLNLRDVLIKRITVTLIQYVKLGPASEKKFNIINETLKTIKHFKGSNLDENAELHLPNTIIPTFTSHFPPKDRVPPIIVKYELHFEAHLPLFSSNIRLQLPLIITDHPQND